MNTGRKNIFLPVSYPSSHSSKLSIPQVINGQRKIYSGSFDPSPSVRPIGPAFKKKVYLPRPRQVDSPFPSGFPWPGGMAEQCNRHRRKGGQCLSQASLHAAGVGEPRRAPEGPCHGQYGFGSFCRNKRTSSYGGETPSLLNPNIIPASIHRDSLTIHQIHIPVILAWC